MRRSQIRKEKRSGEKTDETRRKEKPKLNESIAKQTIKKIQ